MDKNAGLYKTTVPISNLPCSQPFGAESQQCKKHLNKHIRGICMVVVWIMFTTHTHTYVYIYILHWETHQLLLKNKSMCSDDEKHKVRVAFGFCRKMGWFRCDVRNVPPVAMWLVAPWEERKRRRGWAASSTSFGLGLWYWCWEH